MRFERQHSSGSPQRDNREWWERHVMDYDWDRRRTEPAGTEAWFARADEDGFERNRYCGHPRYPDEVPFSRLLDYPSLTGKRVLEVGCGIGAHSGLIARQARPRQLVALDLTSRAVSLTARRVRLFGLPVAVVQADGEALPFRDGHFDFVWSWGVVHHSARPAVVIAEIARVLRPGGECRVMVYNRRSARYLLYGGLVQGVLRGRLASESLEGINLSHTDGFYARHYTRRELAAEFKAAGFSEVRCRTLPDHEVVPLPGWARLDRLMRPLVRPIGRAVMGRLGWFLFAEAVR
jgi:ubiquinone/menaquinone biosynthesis C-methylase UbiE